METPISWQDFEKVALCVGRIVSVEIPPAMRKPAYKLVVDFGEVIGKKISSAQITHYYSPENLLGRLVVAVINFPPKQIGAVRSECLVTGFHDEKGAVRLCIPEGEVPLGSRLM